jgi:hypothetical protein
MNDDEVKKLILSRRARFIAAALAITATDCKKKTPSPGPCLEAPIENEPSACLAVPRACLKHGGGNAPEPCLSQAMPPRDAGQDGAPVGPPPPPKKDAG